MPDTPKLRPATWAELAQSLSFALRCNGRKREHGANEIMARITAEGLIEHLERSGYVVMHKPPLAPRSSTGTNRPAHLTSIARVLRQIPITSTKAHTTGYSFTPNCRRSARQNPG